MPNFSGVWTLKEQGVAIKGDRWQGIPENVFISGVTSRRALEKINLASTGGASDFGEIRSGAGQSGGDVSVRAGFGNGTRGIWSSIADNYGPSELYLGNFLKKVKKPSWKRVVVSTKVSKPDQAPSNWTTLTYHTTPCNTETACFTGWTNS